MARRRPDLRPEDAPNEGARRLRVLLRRLTFGAIARTSRCDESAIRLYARGQRRPIYAIRVVLQEKWGIAEGTWDVPATDDAYETGEPVTAPKPKH